MVNDLEGYEVVGEAEDGEEAVVMAERLKPDIILLDISMHGVDGLEALQRLGTRVPEARVLMLSMHTDAEVVLPPWRKAPTATCSRRRHGRARPRPKAVDRGQRYLSSAIAQPVIEQALNRQHGSEDPGLTQRQVEILRLISRGASTRSIADGLGLSVKTVEAHRAQIMKRLDIHDVPAGPLRGARHHQPGRLRRRARQESERTSSTGPLTATSSSACAPKVARNQRPTWHAARVRVLQAPLASAWRKPSISAPST